MKHRYYQEKDLTLLAKWNHQLIRDESHRNSMTEPELLDRMKGWLAADYSAVIFVKNDEPVAYALYRESKTEVYLRQMFVSREFRRTGIGREVVTILREHYWPDDKRIVVEVLTKNGVGKAFWRAVGFRDYSLALEILP